MTDLALPLHRTSDLELVLDPAQGLSVTVRRHLDSSPVPEWRVLAARVRDCAAGAAGAVEAHGYDLFLAANGGAVGGGEAIGDAGGEDGP